MKFTPLVKLMFILFLIFSPRPALADIGGLTKCSESPAFEKRLKASVKKLEQRKSTFEVGTPPALALQQQEKHNQDLEKYSKDQKMLDAFHPATFNFIQKYVDIQNDSVGEYSDLLNAIQLINTDNKLDVLFFEDEYFEG